MAIKIREGGVWVDILKSASDDTHCFTGFVDPTLTTRPDGTVLKTGDQFINTTSDKLFYWNGSAWDNLSTTDLHSLSGTLAPQGTVTTRQDGTALLSGDQYFDTQNRGEYVYNATFSKWEDVTGSYVQVGAGTPYISSPFTGTATVTGRDTNTPLRPNDLYIDSDSGQSYVWSGGEWDLAAVDTHSIPGLGVPGLTTRLDGNSLLTGDQYIDTSTNQLYFWDGTTWDPIGSSDTHSFTGGGAPTLTVRPDGSALLGGDTYTDGSEFPNVVQYVYDGVSAWNLKEEYHTYTGGGHPTTSSFAAGGSRKQYVNTSTNDFYYWSGAAWVLVGPTELQKDSVATNGFPTTRVNAVDTQLNGDIFEDTDTLRRFYWDSAAAAYVPMGSHNFVQDTTPSVLLTYERDTWIDTTTMQQFVYYNDGSTTQWTQVN